MYCVSIYPTPINKISVPRMRFIKNNCKQDGDIKGEFGISDHSLGINSVVAAICEGATWVEKHFTTDNNLPGPDNKMSITPAELKEMRSFADDYEVMLNNQCNNANEEEINLRSLIKGRFGDNT